MSVNIYRVLAIFVSLLLCISQTWAAKKHDSTIPQIKKYVNTYNDYTIGVIEGDKYIIAHIDGGHSLVVAKVHADITYEPIAYLDQDYFPFQLRSKIEDNSIIISGGQGHHGSYSIEYIFKLKKGVFYLSRFQEKSSYNEDYHYNEGLEIIKVTTVDFEKSVTHYWERHFNLNKKSEYISWASSMQKLFENSSNASMVGGETKNKKFKRKIYSLENFNFKAASIEIYSLTHHSSGTTIVAP